MAADKRPAGGAEWLIVGLGNVGREYENTRHNVGFQVVDRLAHRLHVSVDRMKFHALTAAAELDGHKVLLMKPVTLMNRSGLAVSEAAAFYKIPPERILVICDDTGLPVGKLRTRTGGSAGGHNGLKNIIARLGGNQFPRILVGVGQKPHPDYDLAKWVLSRFSKQEQAALDPVLEQAAQVHIPPEWL